MIPNFLLIWNQRFLACFYILKPNPDTEVAITIPLGSGNFRSQFYFLFTATFLFFPSAIFLSFMNYTLKVKFIIVHLAFLAIVQQESFPINKITILLEPELCSVFVVSSCFWESPGSWGENLILFWILEQTFPPLEHGGFHLSHLIFLSQLLSLEFLDCADNSEPIVHNFLSRCNLYITLCKFKGYMLI